MVSLSPTFVQFLAGFGRGATSIPFWENVYGFNMSRIGREVVEDAARLPIIDVVDSCHIITTTEVLQVSLVLEVMHTCSQLFSVEQCLGAQLIFFNENN